MALAEMKCPYCGAPLKTCGNHYECKYCGAIVVAEIGIRQLFEYLTK